MNRGSNPRGAASIQTDARPRTTDGDVVKWLNTEVCKTSIHRFESGRRLHTLEHEIVDARMANAVRSGGPDAHPEAHPSLDDQLQYD